MKELKNKLKAQGVKYCVGAYVDIHGVPKGKFVPIDHFEDFASGSELYTGYALDGLGQSPNDDEIASLPDTNHIIQLPWQPEVAWMPADNTFKGKPYEVNTRVALKKVIAQAEAMGFSMNLGIECELFVVKQNESGKLEIPNPDDNLTKSCYDVKRFMDRYVWLDKVSTTINDLGWDLYSLDHEDASSQFEFDFKYADALTMCDRYIFFRMMAKQYAAEEGLLATFMPNSYGSNNRTNSLRVPMAGGRVESRNADAACNPYLACTLALAAGLQGIQEQLDPGEAQEDNLYELTPAQLAERGISELPRTLDEAVEAFAADPFVEETLGSELRNEFIKYKSEEWRQYHQRVSQWEIDQYARLY